MTTKQARIELLEGALEEAQSGLKDAQTRIEELERESEVAEDEQKAADQKVEEVEKFIFNLKERAQRYRESFIFPDIGREAEIQAILDLIESAG